MKVKRVAAGLLCACLCVSVTTACSGGGSSSQSSSQSEAKKTEPKGKDIRKLYIRAPKSAEEMTATFWNTASGKTADVKMNKTDESGGSIIYCCDADANLYNMVHVTCGDIKSGDAAFNSFISGWNLRGERLLPYVVGTEPEYDAKFETKTFEFDGYGKKVYIWTPDDYDAKSEEKYSVIYTFDGQSVLTTGVERGMDNDEISWNVSENVRSMTSVTGNKAIVVAIDNASGNRMDELVPDLGEINTEGMGDVKADDLTRKRGTAFADFVCDTVMPYVNENYNVYTDARHTSLSGSSLGGLETFFTVLSHPDKFGTGGVMSATFDMYTDKEWTEFLGDKYDMENAPLLYFYAGGYESDNGDVSQTMYNKLIENGYPKDRLVYSKNESGEHLIDYWRSIYPEFLQAAFTKDVPALEFGVFVQYADKSDPVEKYLEEMEIDKNDLKPGYVYYDNSETKWEKVYAYWWGGPSINSVTKESYYLAEWPGFKMEQIEGTDIYRIVAPYAVTGIIFDSGVTDREVYEGKTAYQTVDLQYSENLMGKVYKIDMSVKPKADPGTMKTKHRYSEGSWSEYKK